MSNTNISNSFLFEGIMKVGFFLVSQSAAGLQTIDVRVKCQCFHIKLTWQRLITQLLIPCIPKVSEARVSF